MILSILIILCAVGVVLIYCCYVISGMIELCDNLRENNINLLKEYGEIRNQFSHLSTKFQEQSYYLNTLCTINRIERRKEGNYDEIDMSITSLKLDKILDEANKCIAEQLKMRGENGNGKEKMSEKIRPGC